MNQISPLSQKLIKNVSKQGIKSSTSCIYFSSSTPTTNTISSNRKSFLIENTSTTSINKNKNKLSCDIKRYYGGGSSGSLFYQDQSSFMTKSYDISQSLSKPKTLRETYRILYEIGTSSSGRAYHYKANFLNQNLKMCPIQALLFSQGGYQSKNRSWIVITGGKEISDWKTTSLSLFLGSLLANKPLANYDVILFPIENTKPYDEDEKFTTTIVNNFDTTHCSSLTNNNNFNNTINNNNNLTSAAAYNNNVEQQQQQQQEEMLDNGLEYTFFNANTKIENNNIDNVPNYQQQQREGVFSKWLKSTKRTYYPMEFQMGSQKFFLNSQTPDKHFQNNNNQIINPPNYILSLKDLNISTNSLFRFNSKQRTDSDLITIQQIGQEIYRQIQIFDQHACDPHFNFNRFFF